MAGTDRKSRDRNENFTLTRQGCSGKIALRSANATCRQQDEERMPGGMRKELLAAIGRRIVFSQRLCAVRALQCIFSACWSIGLIVLAQPLLCGCARRVAQNVTKQERNPARFHGVVHIG